MQKTNEVYRYERYDLRKLRRYGRYAWINCSVLLSLINNKTKPPTPLELATTLNPLNDYEDGILCNEINWIYP